MFDAFKEAKRPLIIYGNGIHVAGAEEDALRFARLNNVPVVCTWAAVDLFRHDDPLFFGGFGTHGVRYANFAVQNADVILSIGSRLDTKATGSPPKDFAPKAKVYMVDIDASEINKFKKFGREVNGIYSGLTNFFIQNMPQEQQAGFPEWILKLGEWKKTYPPGIEVDGLNPYKVMEHLSNVLNPDDVIVTDTGCSLGWLMQAFKFTGQRCIHAFNQTPMGYGVPAAIGAAFAGSRRVVLITGDGGLALSASELATIARHDLPIKILLFNNKGHAMCRQTQRTWMGGEYPSTSYEGGLATPDFVAVAKAYGIPAYSVSTLEEVIQYEGGFTKLLYEKGPSLLNLDIDYEAQISPQVRFGRPLHDADPFLPREELEEVMSV